MEVVGKMDLRTGLVDQLRSILPLSDPVIIKGEGIWGDMSIEGTRK